MRTILIPITSSYIIRSVLRSDTLPSLAAMSDMRIVFLAPEEKLAYYRREFMYPNVFFDILPDAGRARVERMFAFGERASIHSRTAALLARSQFSRRGSHTPAPVRVAVFAAHKTLWSLGRFAWWRKGIRRVYQAVPSSFFRDVLDRWRPDAVFAPTMLPRDAAVLKEAKKRGIATVGMVLSWDNLYSKTILRSHPDLLLVHTEGIKRQAVAFGDYASDRIRVVGIPQFDRLIQKKGAVSRAEFFSSIGADPSKKLIVYALSGKAGLAVEFDVIDLLHRLHRESAWGAVTDVLIRPYPRYDLPEEKLRRIKEQYGFLAERSMAHIGNGKEDWEFDEHSLGLLVNTVAHADIIITMYSTFFIEGSLCGKPLIGVAFDGDQNLDYWNSARRFFEWDHLAAIKPLRGIWLVGNPQELNAAITKCLQDPSVLGEGRKRIAATQCQYLDGESGRRVARILGDVLNGKGMVSAAR